MTFSSTESERMGRTIWKVRPMPRRARVCAGLRVTSSPLKMIDPVVDPTWPEIMLNRVVLPAPFGPMMPRISPRRASMLTSETALSPP